MCLLGEAASFFFERLNGCVRRGGPWKNVNITGTQMEFKLESWLPWWPSKLYSMGVVLATRTAFFCTRPSWKMHDHSQSLNMAIFCFLKSIATVVAAEMWTWTSLYHSLELIATSLVVAWEAYNDGQCSKQAPPSKHRAIWSQFSKLTFFKNHYMMRSISVVSTQT